VLPDASSQAVENDYYKLGSLVSQSTLNKLANTIFTLEASLLEAKGSLIYDDKRNNASLTHICYLYQ